ncbi:MAG: hypothetical protein L6Q84_24450 [Polyangiaceae bacterium]|nr:hypothetical protein [Polyangiaceae bacterium]
MSQLDIAAADPPPRPPVREGQRVELELRRPGSQVLRVVAEAYEGRPLLSLEKWCVPRGRKHWWRAQRVRIAPHEAADVARALVEAGRRARR